MLYKILKPIITGIFNEDTYLDLMVKWNEEHRFYHNLNHLEHMLTEIEELFNKKEISESDRIVLIIIAFFHDAIYNPKSKTNEEDSISYFIECFNKRWLNNEQELLKRKDFVKQVEVSILATKDQTMPVDNISKIIWSIDNSIFSYDMPTLIEYEHEIYKEYQFVDYNTYKVERVKFLKTRIGVFNNVVDFNLNQLITYVINRRPNVAIFAGSFNPFHIGHLSILTAAEKIFEKVIVVFAINPDKEHHDVVIPENISNRECVVYSGLITDIITLNENYNQNITLIRGIRNGHDLEYETNQRSFILDIKSDVKIIYIPTNREYNHISSSAIKSLMKFDKEKAKKYII